MDIKSKNPNYIFQKEADNDKYYHYTGFEGFWKIIENESMLATQALFSNDSQEISKGKELLESSKKVISNVKKIDVDSYILCFCKVNDKLSQWRGYCNKGGISLEFEINNTGPDVTHYYLIKSENDKTFYYPIETHLYPVVYSYDDKSNSQIHILSQQIMSNKKILNNIERNINEKSTNFQISRIVNSSIPLIKNSGFYEEEEYRILFENYIDSATTKGIIEEFVQYREKNDRRTPYVTVKFGKNENEYSNNVDIVYIVINKNYIKDNTNISNILDSTYSKKQISDIFLKKGNKEKAYNFIRTAKKVKKICDKNNIKTEIIIKDMCCIKIGTGANQKNIFQQIDYSINANSVLLNNKITPIYCEGHLPIRSVMISPSENQNEVYESVSHFFKYGNKYWLKYVNVKKSSIPYREPK